MTVYVVLTEEPDIMLEEATICAVLVVAPSLADAKAEVIRHVVAHVQPDVKEVRLLWPEPDADGCWTPVVQVKEVGRRTEWHEEHWRQYTICKEAVK